MGLQRSVSGEEPTAAELDTMTAVLDETQDQGFLGLSSITTKLDRLNDDRRWAKPLPSIFARWSEFRRLNRLLRSRRGILQSAPDAVGKLAYSNSRFSETGGYAPNLDKERVYGKFLSGENNKRPALANPTKLTVPQAAWPLLCSVNGGTAEANAALFTRFINGLVQLFCYRTVNFCGRLPLQPALSAGATSIA